MLRLITTVVLTLFFAWCLLPVPTLRSLIGVAMARTTEGDHWTKSDYYYAANEGDRVVLTVQEPVATFDERFGAEYFPALCDTECKI